MIASQATTSAICSNCGNHLKPAMRRCRECGAAASPDESTDRQTLTSSSAQCLTETNSSSTECETQAEQLETETAAPIVTQPSESSAKLRLICGCGKKLKIDRKFIGRTVQCPKCSQTFVATESVRHSTLAPNAPPIKKTGFSAEQTPAAGDDYQPIRNTSSPTADADLELDGEELERLSNQQRLDHLTAEIDAALLRPDRPDDSELKPTLKPAIFEKLETCILDCDVNDRESVESCRQVISKLANSKDARALDVVAIQARSSNPALREAVAFACGLIPQPETVRFLIEYLGDADAAVRRAAMQSLETKGDQRMIRPLLALASFDKEARAKTVDLIVKMKNEAVDSLIGVLQQEESDWSSLAAMSLGKIGTRSSIAALSDLLSHPSSAVRLHALDGLGRLIEKGNIIRTVTKALDDLAPEVRTSAVRLLAKTQDESCVPKLLKKVEDPDRAVRLQTVQALSGRDDSKTISRLIDLIEDEDREIREAAIESLGRSGEQKAIPSILKLVDGARVDPAIAMSALRRLKNTQSSPVLIQLLDSPDPNLRRHAIEALACCTTDSVQTKIIQCLSQDRDTQVRATSARALAKTPDASTVPNLRTALDDETPVRVQAVIALGEIGHSSCYSPLMQSLFDPAPPVRYHSAVALGKLGNPRAIESLRKLVDDKDAMVARGVEASLKLLGENKSERRWLRTKGQLASFLEGLAPSVLFSFLPSSPALLGGIATVLFLAGFSVWYFFISESGPNSTAGLKRGDVKAVAVLPSSSRIVAVRTLGLIEVWKANGTSPERQWDAEATGGIFPLQRADEFAYWSGTRFIWSSASDGDPVSDESVEQHSATILGGGFAPDRTSAITFTATGEVCIWDLSSKQFVKKLNTAIPLQSAAISQGSETIALGSRKNRLVLIQVEDGEKMATLELKNTLSALSFHTTEPVVIGASILGRIKAWNLTNGSERDFGDPTANGAPISVMAFSPDGTKFATGSSAGIVKIWDYAEATSESIDDIEADQIDSLAFTDNGDQLVVGSAEHRQVWIVNVASASVQSELEE